MEVEILKSRGKSDAAIARALCISAHTLRKRCVQEIANGNAQHRRAVIEELFRVAETGNVKTIVLLDKLSRSAGGDKPI